MEIAKWIFLILIIGFALWLVIDTTIWAVKKIKAKKQEKLEQQNQIIDNNDNK